MLIPIVTATTTATIIPAISVVPSPSSTVNTTNNHKNHPTTSTQKTSSSPSATTRWVPKISKTSTLSTQNEKSEKYQNPHSDVINVTFSDGLLTSRRSFSIPTRTEYLLLAVKPDNSRVTTLPFVATTDEFSRIPITTSVTTYSVIAPHRLMDGIVNTSLMLVSMDSTLSFSEIFSIGPGTEMHGKVRPQE